MAPAAEQHNEGVSTLGLCPLTTENVVISMSLVVNLASDSSFEEKNPTKRWKRDGSAGATRIVKTATNMKICYMYI